MNGVTKKGVVIKARRPGMATLTMVPSAKNLPGQTGSVSSKKSSQSAGFGASKKCGSVRGTTGR
jgi:hypothetical protein